MPAADATEPASPELMLAFYRRLYPFKSLFAWLNHEHAPTRLFTHREFAFTLPGDVYLRYNSFTTAEDLKKQVCQYNPTRFEIGPVYTARPRDRKTVRPAAFAPQLRELVFDIDMTDYDAVRTCCAGADICARCWAFIAAAVRVLDAAVRDQLGFRHLLWVYSGRRGIHLWVSDPDALALTDEERRALVGWMTVVQGGKDMHKKVNVRTSVRGVPQALPPSLQTALEQLERTFGELCLDDQECFLSEEGTENLLRLIPDKQVAGALRKKWEASPARSSQDKWDDLRKQTKALQSEAVDRFYIMKAAREDIVLQYTYPRLDAEVSKHRNHLLKAPFCIHPKTGRVCVPVDPAAIDSFRPEAVPTVSQLLRELDAAVPADGAGEQPDWEKTSLKPYVDMLDRHVQALMEEVRWRKRGTDLTW